MLLPVVRSGKQPARATDPAHSSQCSRARTQAPSPPPQNIHAQTYADLRPGAQKFLPEHYPDFIRYVLAPLEHHRPGEAALYLGEFSVYAAKIEETRDNVAWEQRHRMTDNVRRTSEARDAERNKRGCEGRESVLRQADEAKENLMGADRLMHGREMEGGKLARQQMEGRGLML